jgi:hypothetical protein
MKSLENWNSQHVAAVVVVMVKITIPFTALWNETTTPVENGGGGWAMERDQTGRKERPLDCAPAKEGHRVLFYTASVTDEQRAAGGGLDAPIVRLVAPLLPLHCLLLLVSFSRHFFWVWYRERGREKVERRGRAAVPSAVMGMDGWGAELETN